MADMGVSFRHALSISKRENSERFGIHLSFYQLTFPRQKNMDYAIVQAMKYNTEGLTEQCIVYDVACQWKINFSDRVEASDYLSPPLLQKLLFAVGKFHLGAHIPTCFFGHSLNFIPGTGQVDGEIIETLWSGLNKVSYTARAMTKAHRREVMDDYMRDWNFKKLTGCGVFSYLFSFLIFFSMTFSSNAERQVEEVCGRGTNNQRGI